MAMQNDLSGLMKWMERPEWASMFQTVFSEHVHSACDAAQVGVAELAEVLGNHVAMIMFGCAFEDFLTREGDDGKGIVDDYLKRRGWKEPVRARRYMEALRDSDMSLYEASEIVPGQSFLARDLLRGGDPVRVMEQTATRSMATWDRLATRIVLLSGKHVMSGGTLVFDHALAEAALRELRGAMRGLGKVLKQAAAEGPGVPVGAEKRQAILGELVAFLAAPLLTGMWLEDALNRALGRKNPAVVNSEGDAIEFHTVRYPLLPDAAAEVVGERLDAVAGLRRDGSGWDWIEAAAKSGTRRQGASKPTGTLASVTYTEDGDVVTGRVDLDDGAVMLSVNSRARADRGRALLSAALAGLTRTPLTQIETVDQALAARETGSPAPATTIPSETETQILSEFLETHYRGLLDQPIPTLGNVTPREAARRPAGRKKVVEWLKYLEHGTARAKAQGDALGDYDFTWMWTELGVEDLRR